MSVTLRIKFTGLFMFVRHRRTLHVILPATSGSGRHAAWLSEIECSHGRPLQGNGAITLVDIRPCPLDELQVPERAFDTGLVTGTPFPLCQLGNAPTSAVHLRMDLPLPSQPLEPGDTASWDVCGKPGPYRLTHQMTYTLRGEALPTLGFVRKRFGSTKEEERIALRPNGPDINLFIRHLPPSEPHCTDVRKGHPASHVASYYSLYCPSVKGTIPRLAHDPVACRPAVPQCGLKRMDDASTFTCMVGKATPPPG